MPEQSPQPELTEPFSIGGVEIANRVLLAPLAGIGNWFVRLQARRHGAGLAVSEMVSSFGLHHRNERTMRELLRIHPDEHPVSVQLFGHDADVMRSAAEVVAGAGADLIDINMGCPVRKVLKTGAGAALVEDPELALALLRGAREGSGLPVTVKVRSGLKPGDRTGYDLARELTDRIDVPVIISGGLSTADAAREAYRRSGAAAVMIARGSLGYPWVFDELTGGSAAEPGADEVVAELLWVIDRAEEHMGADRAGRYLRKFYPWYLEHLDVERPVIQEMQTTAGLDRVRELIGAGAGAGAASDERAAVSSWG